MKKRIIATLSRLAPSSEVVRRGLAAAVLIPIAFAASPSGIVADSSPDFEIPNGHFYSQANGLSPTDTDKGYTITNDEAVPFWTVYQQLGGVPILGYPASQRFTWFGRVTQVTQRAILHWHEEENRVELVNILDYLSQLGKDDWLSDQKWIPKPLEHLAQGSDDVLDGVLDARLALLDEDAGIKYHFFSNPAAQLVYGLPMSRAEVHGTVVTMRFQRAAVQRWLIDSAQAKEGDVTAMNIGDIAKELGVFPAAALEPVDAPAPPPSRVMASSRGGTTGVTGLATWYGAGFHGQLMRNEEPYNMYDSSIAASNIHALGTLLRVTNTSTGKSIIVRVADTGAFYYPVVVDLSWAAFSEIADPDDGVIEVTVEPLRDS
ncbi:MAG: hypothetical protein HY675_25305 [Chloroflexi bacterium]|nr:hypothetical protein [Chloroflexota bacterium]